MILFFINDLRMYTQDQVTNVDMYAEDTTFCVDFYADQNYEIVKESLSERNT